MTKDEAKRNITNALKSEHLGYSDTVAFVRGYLKCLYDKYEISYQDFQDLVSQAEAYSYELYKDCTWR